jgi:hypothetical protein
MKKNKSHIITLIFISLITNLYAVEEQKEEKRKEGIITFASGSYIKSKNDTGGEFNYKDESNPLKEVYIWHDGKEIINTQEHILIEDTERTTDRNHGLRARAEGTIAINKEKMVITPDVEPTQKISTKSSKLLDEEVNHHVFGGLAYDKAKIINDGEIELTSLDLTTGKKQIGMGAFTGAQVINNGNITGSAKAGIYVNGEDALGINNGNINHIGPNGMVADGLGSLVVNKGKISNTGESGMKAINGGIAVNTKDGIIENKKIDSDKSSGKYAMFARGENSQIINEGILRNEEYGGLKIEEGALGINNNLIQSKGKAGISVSGIGSFGINNGVIENEERNGIETNDGAASINNGIIRNKDNFGMQASGEGSVAINNEKGIIENTGNRGLVASNSGVAHNFGIINNGKGQSLYANSNGTVINEETGRVTSSSKTGIYIRALGTGINKGKIENKGSNGAIVTIGGTFTNEETGVIENSGEYGVRVGDDINEDVKGINSIAVNKGIIRNTREYGVYVKTGKSNFNGNTTILSSTFINEESGIIENNGRYGVSVKGDVTQNIGDLKLESHAINKGTIRNKGSYGMHTSGGIIINSSTGKIENTGNYRMYGEDYSTVINEGKLAIAGNNQTAIYVDDSSIAINKGEITVNGNSNKAMEAKSGSTIINEKTGVIKLEGTNGIGLYATGTGSKIENKGTIILSNNNEIKGNQENETDAKGNTAIKLEAGATFVNSGEFKVEGDLDFSNMGDGKFEISQGGTIEADSIKGNFYASGALTLGSYEDTYSTYRMLKTDKIDGEVKSNSAMFTSKLTEKNENGYYDIIMERKNFNDILNNNSIANALENSYVQRNSNSKKDRLFDALKLLPTEKTLNEATEMIYGNKIYPTIRQQSFDFIKLNNDKIKSNVLSQTNITGDIRYIGGIDYSIIDQDSSDSFTGYITKAKGIYLGVDKHLNDSYRVGGIINITDINTNFSNNDRREDRMYQGTLYGIYDKNNTNLTSTLFLGKLDGKLNRTISFSTINEKMKGDIDNNYFGLTNQLEHKFDLNYFYIKPKAEANLIVLYQNEINEKGEYGLNIQKESNRSFETGIGFDIGKDIKFNNGVKVSLNQGIMYRYEFADTTKSVDAQLKDVIQDRVKLSENDRKRDSSELVTKLEITKNNFGIYGEYKYTISKNQDRQVSTLGLTYKF